MLIGSCNLLCGLYIIRDATFDDKNKYPALYRRCNKFYRDYNVDSDIISRQLVYTQLLASCTHGFAFVVEDLSVGNEGAILAFLFKNRSIGKGSQHVISSSLESADPEFSGEMLMTQLYVHLLNQIKEYYPDILRVEGVCPARSVATISIFESCGFEKESIRCRSVQRFDRSFDDEIVFVWWNFNFAPHSV